MNAISTIVNMRAKLLCGLLAVSATAGIVCAFLTVLERVQNWPVFNAWIGRLLGA